MLPDLNVCFHGIDLVFEGLPDFCLLQNLPHQLVVRLTGIFYVLERPSKIVVKRSVMILGEASTDTKMSMIVLSSPIEFQNQTSISRVHVLKPKGVEFCLHFNFVEGAISKVTINIFYYNFMNLYA